MGFFGIRRYGWGAALVVLSFFAVTLIWLSLDHYPANWDDAFYLTNSLVLFDTLAEGGLPAYFGRFFTILPNKAPLIAALPTPVYLAFGRNPRFAPAVNLVAVILLFWALYLVGKKLAGARTGFLAVAIAGTMPLLYGLGRWYLVEYCLTALVCVSVYLLAESENAANGWAPVALGIAGGFGLLLKASFVLYVAPLFLFGICVTRRRMKAALSFSIPAILIAAPWYLFHYQDVISTAWHSAYSNEAAVNWGTGRVFSAAAIGLYLEHVVRNGVSDFYAWLALALGLYLAARRSWPMSRRAAWICALWILPFCVFLFAPNKDIRFLAPLLPAFALALALAVDAAIPADARWSPLLLCALLAFPFLAMIRTSFGLPVRGRDVGYARHFSAARWPYGDILHAAVSSVPIRSGERLTLIVGTDTDVFNANNLQLQAARSRFPLDISSSAYENDLNGLLQSVRTASFFAYEEGGPAIEAGSFNRHRAALVAEVKASGHFAEVDSRKLPDGGTAHLFRNLARDSFIRDGLRFRGRSFSPSGSSQPPEFSADFADEIRLEGLAVEPADGVLRVTYRWRCLRPPSGDYWCFTHVLDEGGSIVAYLDHDVLGGAPSTVTWQPGDAATEQLEFTSPQMQEGGRYRLRLGLFRFASSVRLAVSRSASTPFWDIAGTDAGTAVVARHR